jgi:carboxymethylenebutenolidase
MRPTLEARAAARNRLPSPRGSGYGAPMIFQTESIDVAGPAGAIRTLVCAPRLTDGPGGSARRFPGVVFFSDIFQLTGPMVRAAQRLAGHGYVVMAPELYGRIEPAGTALDFERDRQRALDDSDRMKVEELDADRRAVLDALKARPDVDPGRIAAAGFCFGGHLAFRAALEPDVKATSCFYGTGIHSGRLGATTNADSLARASEIRGELLLVWGRSDPHIPAEGRARIHRALEDAAVRFEARLFDAEHAFMRDEGPRYDPAATDRAFAAMLELFQRAV